MRKFGLILKFKEEAVSSIMNKKMRSQNYQYITVTYNQ